MAKVFISYSSKNRDLVKSLAADIEELGHDVWFDKELTGGHAWWDSILKAIRDSEVFIFALSPQALDSEPCSREYKYADALNKTILPVLITGTVSANLLPRELSLIQYVDYRQADKAATLKLGRAFTAIPAPSAMPNPLPAPPDAPVASILGLRDEVDSPKSLSFEQQTTLLFQLKEELKNPATKADAQALLQRLRNRRDILASVQGQIDEVVKDKGFAWPSPKQQTPKVAPLQVQEQTYTPAPQYGGSIWMPNWMVLLGSILVWWTPFVVVKLQGYILFYNNVSGWLISIGLPWILQGILILFLAQGEEKKTFASVLNAAFASGALAIQQIRFKDKSFQRYVQWFFINMIAITGTIFLYFWLIVIDFWNGQPEFDHSNQLSVFLIFALLGTFWAYLFSIFKNIAKHSE